MRRRLAVGARADEVELLEAGVLSPTEVEANLADLARMNRLPGGAATSIAAIEHLSGRGARTRVLDVGTGRADMPIAFARRGWSTVAVDTNHQVLAVARRATARTSLVEVMEADVRALPLEDGAFDVAHSSLLIHHLDPSDVVDALREMARVARRGVVINDLRRGFFPLVATAVTVTAFGRSRVTRTDGMISARRAYSIDELDELLSAAGLTRRWQSARWLPRVVTAASAP